MKRKLKLLGMETTLKTIIYLCWGVKMGNGWTLLVSFVIRVADRNPNV
jgi:hypothetical protein